MPVLTFCRPQLRLAGLRQPGARGRDRRVGRAATQDAYVARAIELARDRSNLGAQAATDRRRGNPCLLFDTPRLVRDLENLYRGMWDEFLGGRRPVPDLSNLDAYHDVGLEISLENLPFLTRRLSPTLSGQARGAARDRSDAARFAIVEKRRLNAFRAAAASAAGWSSDAETTEELRK